MEKATFRALREMVGLSQSEVAAALGYSVQSVKKWERAESPEYRVPERAAEYMEREFDAFRREVMSELSSVDGPEEVTLPYDRMDQRANAASRAVASVLMSKGVRVRWEY